MNKCKGCEWYGKPYWSIINPCDNCPRENTNIEIITRWQDPTIKELQEENEELKVENEKLTQLWLNSQEKRRKAIHLIRHNDIMDYRVFEEELLNILQGDDSNEKTME